jgi:hypothetical protein
MRYKCIYLAVVIKQTGKPNMACRWTRYSKLNFVFQNLGQCLETRSLTLTVVIEQTQKSSKTCRSGHPTRSKILYSKNLGQCLETRSLTL